MLSARLMSVCLGLAVSAAATNDWEVDFNASASTLTLRHTATGTRLNGQIAVTATRNGKAAPLKLQAARDQHATRLAIVDSRNEVNGYLNVVADGARVTLFAVPRPPAYYSAQLTFTANSAFGAQAFACRTQAQAIGQVVQMASGPADSLLNNAIFDPARDLLLRFTAGRVAISTQAGPQFQAQLEAAFSDAGYSVITLELVDGYYRRNYVPHYRLIDRKRTPTAPTGWMSWNTYFDPATEQDNLDNARIAARTLLPFGLRIWQIESWQENSPKLPVSNFGNLTMRASPEKFPHGMKWLADQLRALGFRPGIWTVPWGTGSEEFYNAHRGWFLHDANGKPFQSWSGRYMLDPSMPEVRRHMEETHRTMSKEWGYEVFKIDGLAQEARLLERPDARAAFHQKCDEPYRLSIEALRRGIGGDRVLMACQGSYYGPDVTVADSTRVGGDLVVFPHPPNWHSYVTQARVTLAQMFTNNLIWYTDPDTLKVGEPATIDMARIATTVVALPGQLTYLSDKLGELSPERMRLLQQALPVCDVHPLDLQPVSDLKPIWDLKLRRPFGAWDVVSVFNWGDAARTFSVAMSELGLDPSKSYIVYDFWSRKLVGVRKGAFDIAVEPHANALLAVHELKAHPQFVSSDRHISQGGVELEELTWNAADAQFISRVKMVGNHPLTLSIHVPDHFTFTAATPTGATVEKTTVTGRLLTVELRRATAGEATLALKFAAR